jgi:hypothetical protein
VTDRAVEYRRLSRQCLNMARTAGDEEMREALEQMAQTWLRLAEEQEAATQLDEPGPSSQHPQQQQQAQPKDDDKDYGAASRAGLAGALPHGDFCVSAGRVGRWQRAVRIATSRPMCGRVIQSSGPLRLPSSTA